MMESLSQNPRVITRCCKDFPNPKFVELVETNPEGTPAVPRPRPFDKLKDLPRSPKFVEPAVS